MTKRSTVFINMQGIMNIPEERSEVSVKMEARFCEWMESWKQRRYTVLRKERSNFRNRGRGDGKAKSIEEKGTGRKLDSCCKPKSSCPGIRGDTYCKCIVGPESTGSPVTAGVPVPGQSHSHKALWPVQRCAAHQLYGSDPRHWPHP